MQIIKLKNNRIKLIAEENKIIKSKSTHYDEELKKEIVDVEAKIIYLGKNDSEDNYEEIEETVENVDNAEDSAESVV